MNPSRMRFTDRVAVVTGAASGIGKATAMLLASEGARVAAIDRNAEGAEETAAAIPGAGGDALGCSCNVADSAVVRDAAALIEGHFGRVDVLANVAGVGDTAGIEGLEAIDDARWALTLAVNLSGPFFLCRAFLPGMAARGAGAVVNVSSVAGGSKRRDGGT